MIDNPYGSYVAGQDLLVSLAETANRIEALARPWTAAQFERSYQPGKWTARQIMIHLAHAEMVFATRLRFALAQPDSVAASYDQDDWMRAEPDVDGQTALTAYTGLRQMTLALCRTLTTADRARPLAHAQLGQLDVEWVMTMFAGHERHHLPQLEAIGRL